MSITRPNLVQRAGYKARPLGLCITLGASLFLPGCILTLDPVESGQSTTGTTSSDASSTQSTPTQTGESSTDSTEPTSSDNSSSTPTSSESSESSSSESDSSDSSEQDPFLWLEEVESKASLEWVKANNSSSQKALEAVGGFADTKKAIKQLLDSKDKIPQVTGHGDKLYNIWKGEKQKQGLWRRTTLESFQSDTPEWEEVLDLDELSKKEGKNWVWKGVTCIQGKHHRCMVLLSDGGTDATVAREFDLDTKQFVDNGFALPNAKSSVTWLNEDTLVAGIATDDEGKTDSGYPIQLRMWKRGTEFGKAPVVLRVDKSDMWASGQAFQSSTGRVVVLENRPTFFEREYSLLDESGKTTKMSLPTHARLAFWQDWVIVEAKEEWKVDGKTWPQGSVLAAPKEAFLAGKRDFQVLYTPDPRKAFGKYVLTKEHIVVVEKNEVVDYAFFWSHSEKDGWTKSKIEIPNRGEIKIRGFSGPQDGRAFAEYSDLLTPPTLYLLEGGNTKATVLKQKKAEFEADNLKVEQYFATSKDGTKVPYFVLSSKDLKLDGKNPTIQYGYGGFELNLEPRYSPKKAISWVKKGGVYVFTNIRGGGEFGPAWHRAALKENRQRAYDDFIAIGEDLIKRKITSPKHLGITGRSNGGLLMGVMLHQRPELWNAIVIGVPLLDMKRYNKLLAGASWMGEYGNPDKPEEWDYISKYSPYQNVKGGVEYPAVYFYTSTKDDRVHPAHARKMMAKLRSLGHDELYYYESPEGGHKGGLNNDQSAMMTAYEYVFFADKLGLKL